MTTNNGLPTGLLSFVYNASNNTTVKAEAQSDLANVMNDFELTSDQKRIISEISKETGLTDSLWEQLSAELRPEIEHSITKVW